ncbi:MAG: Gfo/Idh/MocA family protein [Chloroflexota bacterium]
MKRYRAAVVGCSRMGAFIDNEAGESVVLPYSHAAGYEACPRTELIAGADLRQETLEAFGHRYGVPPERRYTDYRQMIERERPDIVSITTQPEQHAEVALFAAEHGVRALYCEKPLCASMAEAEAVVAAVERHGVAYNMGTNRRWDPGFDAMRDVIASGELGALKTIVIYSTGALFGTATHWFDLALRLNGDVPAAWVQGHLPRGDAVLDGEVVVEDPVGQGIVAFDNGVMAHALLSPRRNENEAICERGTVTTHDDGVSFQLQRLRGDGRDRRFETAPFPRFQRASSTLRLIEDLVHALDTGEPTRGGVRLAKANLEVILAFIESHRRGGARVSLPLSDCALRLDRRDLQPRQPTYVAAPPRSIPASATARGRVPSAL